MKELTFIILFLLFLIPPCSAQVLNGGFEDFTHPPLVFDNWTSGESTTGNPYSTIDGLTTGSAYAGSYAVIIKANIQGNNSAYSSYTTYLQQNVDLTGYANLTLYYKAIRDSAGEPNYEAEACIYIGNDKYVLPWQAPPWTYYVIDVSGYNGVKTLKLSSKMRILNYTSMCADTSLYLDQIVLVAPQTYTLSGYVTNNLGSSVSAAAITLNNSGGSTNSNDTGYYEITGILSDIYTITATSPTHVDYSDTVSITANTEKNISMTRLTPLLTWTDAETTKNDVYLKWRRNAVVDNVRIYKDTETRLLTTVSFGSTLAGLYSDRNLDCDKGYVYWLQPMDNDIAGPKYRIDAKTDPCDGGGGGGGDPTPTPSPTATPGPTPPPWTNITQEEWLNLTLDQKQEILANMSLFPPLLEFQWDDIYVWGIHLFLILCGAVALDSITIQKVSEYTGLWAILPGVMFAYLTGYLVI